MLSTPTPASGRTDIAAYLDMLAANNSRPWFQAHRDLYEEARAQWLSDLDTMIAAMAVWEPRLASLCGRDCAYRIYRDTRFSPDKTPYKVYMSAAMSPMGRRDIGAGYYLQLDSRPGESGLYAGLWCPDAGQLRKMRHAIVDNIEEWEQVTMSPEVSVHFDRWVGNELKTVPRGWPKDHPQAWALRMKDYGRLCQLDRDFFAGADWPVRAAAMFADMKGMVDFINYTLFEE